MNNLKIFILVVSYVQSTYFIKDYERKKLVSNSYTNDMPL